MLDRINLFYCDYVTSGKTVSEEDMQDLETLICIYRDIWLFMDEYAYCLSDSEQSWLLALYGDLGDYIEGPPAPIYKWQSATMGNLVQTFGEVIAQEGY